MNFKDYEHLGNDWYPTSNTLSRAIYKRNFNGTEMRLLECLKAKTYAYPRKDGKRIDRVWISLTELSSQVGAERRTIRRAMERLIKNKVVTKYANPSKEDQTPGCYGINSKVEHWKIKQLGERETYPQHTKKRAKGGRPIVNMARARKEFKTYGHFWQKTYGHFWHGSTPKPMDIFGRNLWTFLSIGYGHFCPQVLYYAARNHAADGGPTKTLYKEDTERESAGNVRKEEKSHLYSSRNGGDSEPVERPRHEVAFHLMVKMLAEDYFRCCTMPGYAVQAAQKLAFEHRDNLDELWRVWRDEWNEMKRYEKRSGKTTRVPQRIFDLVDREMRRPKPKPTAIAPQELPVAEYIPPAEKFKNTKGENEE